MDAPVVITRDIDLDLLPEEAWALIAGGEGWAEWMVDRADVDVSAGQVGTVEEGGQRRDVHIGLVGDQRVTFDWWPSDQPALGSTVELILEPRRAGVVLHVVETFPRRSALSASAALRWSGCFALTRV